MTDRSRLTPQALIVLDHLRRAGSITGIEAETIHKVRHLPRRIADLRAAGIAIISKWRKDLTKQRYVRYFLENAA
jgi:hypothetical protein